MSRRAEDSSRQGADFLLQATLFRSGLRRLDASVSSFIISREGLKKQDVLQVWNVHVGDAVPVWRVGRTSSTFGVHHPALGVGTRFIECDQTLSVLQKLSNHAHGPLLSTKQV